MKVGYGIGTALAAIAATPATAQIVDDRAPPAVSDTGALDDIVVTAQKRSENLQRVPIAVTAVSGDQLTDAGITSTLQLNAVSPGVNVRTTLGAFQPAVRGIGTSSNVVENPVALYVDGVYIPQQREGIGQLVDVAQIAVLKGPQGTLFGRNATGGVVQITTKAPSRDFGGEASAELDNYRTFRSNVYVTGPLGEDMAASVSAYVTAQGRGYGRSLTTGGDTFRMLHDFGGRAKFALALGATDVTLGADYKDYRQRGNSFRPYPGTNTPYPGSLPLDSPFDTRSGADAILGFKGGGASLTVEHPFDFAKLLSISAYRKGTGEFFFDDAMVAQNYFLISATDNPNESYSQELQLVSNDGGALDWVAGAYYFHSRNGIEPIYRIFTGPLSPMPTSVARTTTFGEETAESIAPFAQAGLRVLQDTRLTLGIRFTHEKRDLVGSVTTDRNNGARALAGYSGDIAVSKLSYRAAIDHSFSRDVMAYASYNTGIKSGGFNIMNPANPAYRPEKLTAYEVGLKSELLGRRVRLNIAAFYYDYANVQVIRYVNAINSIVNGAGAELYGVDVDLQAQVSPELLVTGGLEVLHTAFTDYRDAAFGTPIPTGGAVLSTGDATGNRLPLAQPVTATLAIDYERDYSFGRLHLNASGNYNGRYYFEADNFLQQPSYVMLNASARWSLPGNALSLTLWGKNLLDKKIITQTSTQTLGYPTSYGQAPLTFGLTAKYGF